MSDRQILLITGLTYALLVCTACILALGFLRLARARFGFTLRVWPAIVLLAFGFAFAGYLVCRGRPVGYWTALVLAVLAGSLVGSVAHGPLLRRTCTRRALGKVMNRLTK